MDHVNLNDATPWQLMVLFGLQRSALELVVLSRPFKYVTELQRLYDERQISANASLTALKLDPNDGTVEEIVRNTGVSRRSAEGIVTGRPYLFERQLRIALTPADYEQISQLYGIRGVSYVDKLTGNIVQLATDPSRVLVSKFDTEGLQPIVSNHKLKEVFPNAKGAVYSVLSIPESEESDNIVDEVQKVYGRNVIPAYIAHDSSYRYFNPRFCVVQFKNDVTLEKQREVIAQLGLDIEETHRCPGLYTVRIVQTSPSAFALSGVIERLNAREEVSFAEPNYLGFDDHDLLWPARAFQPRDETESAEELPWNFSLIRVAEAWNVSKGSSDVVIAIIDSGVDVAHPALQGAIVSRSSNDNWNFTSTEGFDPIDEEGHGTFIAGILVGNSALGVRGVCPKCRILPIKVPLTGEASSYAQRRAGILHALDVVSDATRLIYNLSWKTTGDVSLIRDAIQTVTARGATVVASAGNEPVSANQAHFPSDYPSVISVAAVGPDKRRPYYSFYGDEVDLAGPGGDDTSLKNLISSSAPNGLVTTGIGTSFAAPHVAGVAALVVSSGRASTSTSIRSVLESSASALSDQGMGRGLVDAAAALEIPGASTALELVNQGDLQELVTKLGILRFTARLLIARRPFASLAQIRGVSGLSEQLYAAILAYHG